MYTTDVLSNVPTSVSSISNGTNPAICLEIPATAASGEAIDRGGRTDTCD
jgi:hypothetical protein